MQNLEGQHFDAVVIGCGMSGLAAGIRLALYDKKVLILERHNAPGGLNSFYSFEGRKYDVGLHALTNFQKSRHKITPLTRVYRQLRLPQNAFAAIPQKSSRIHFPSQSLFFTNNIDMLKDEIVQKFPKEVDGFCRLVDYVDGVHLGSFGYNGSSARAFVAEYIQDPLLQAMLLYPVVCYGSAREEDMDLSAFIALFQAIYLEGFSRPQTGVRHIIRTLLDKYRSLGGKRKMKCGVQQLSIQGDKVSSLLLDNGETITANHVISSIGLSSTLGLCSDFVRPKDQAQGALVSPISFLETITITQKTPRSLGWEDTIVFFSTEDRYYYSKPKEAIDGRSGVICMPNNYDYGPDKALSEGVLRVAVLANYDYWTQLPENKYRAKKQACYEELTARAAQVLGGSSLSDLRESTIAQDAFTPRTITKFTGHLGGAVYGSPKKIYDGSTPYGNLYLCGADQGLVGVVGALVSGIAMANAHILSRGFLV